MAHQSVFFWQSTIFALWLTTLTACGRLLTNDPDWQNPSIEAMVTSKGYPLDLHSVTTSDGYIITFHRIPHGKNGSSSEPRPPVFFGVFGLGQSSMWAVETADKNIALLMADLGYDVWLGNLRGNTYGKKHITLPTKSRRFWDFSAVEHALIDIPAQIDDVLRKTGFSQLYYVGHSQGTFCLFTLLSEIPAYNLKVRAAALLGSLRANGHGTHPISMLIRAAKYVSRPVLEFFTGGEMLGQGWWTEALAKLCEVSSVFNKAICVTFFKFSSALILNETRAPIFMRHFPSGTSAKNIVYLSQLGSGISRHYDYGPEENKNRYNASDPPKFDASKITASIRMFGLAGDNLTPCAEMEEVYTALTNVTDKQKHCYPDKSLGHFNFIIWAKRLTLDIFKEIDIHFKNRPL